MQQICFGPIVLNTKKQTLPEFVLADLNALPNRKFVVDETSARVNYGLLMEWHIVAYADDIHQTNLNDWFGGYELRFADVQPLEKVDPALLPNSFPDMANALQKLCVPQISADRQVLIRMNKHTFDFESGPAYKEDVFEGKEKQHPYVAKITLDANGELKRDVFEMTKVFSPTYVIVYGKYSVQDGDIIEQHDYSYTPTDPETDYYLIHDGKVEHICGFEYSGMIKAYLNKEIDTNVLLDLSNRRLNILHTDSMRQPSLRYELTAKYNKRKSFNNGEIDEPHQ